MYISCLNKCRNVQIKEEYNLDIPFFVPKEVSSTDDAKYLKGKSVDDTLDSFYINYLGFRKRVPCEQRPFDLSR